MRVLAIGECMVELSRAGGDLWRQGFAGDTFNTAWYLRALLPDGAEVAYLTALGRDPLSEAMLGFMAAAGIDTAAIRRHPDRVPGLYMIELENGERRFTYWRDSSAARTLADDEGHLEAALRGTDLVYLSGITLAILAPDRRAALLAALARAGCRVAFDPNLRPRLWPDAGEMRDWIMRAAAAAEFVLPSFEDEAAGFGDADPAATAARYAASGAAEVVVKNGGGPMLARLGTAVAGFDPPARARPVDSTGAGDAFNAGYLATRLGGAAPQAAMAAGHSLAARVIARPGALLPLADVPATCGLRPA